MARIKEIISENIKASSKIDANLIKGQSYEGLPVATNVKSGIVMIDNVTIKNNNAGQLYCTTTGGSGNDNPEFATHIQTANIHLTTAQTNTISSSATHIADNNKHLTTSEKTAVGKVDAHIANANIHINQDKITQIELSANHIADSTLHLSVTDKTNLSSIPTHISNSGIHVTAAEKTKIGTIDTHIANSSLHLSTTDRENINSSLSVSSTVPGHISNNNVHFSTNEKELLLQRVTANEALADDITALGESVNGMALDKLDKKNHEINKILITDSTGNVVYHPSLSSTSIKVVTNDLTNALKTNYDAAYTHSTSAHAPSTANANVQSDWNATSGDALIKNKPTSLPANGGNADTVGGKKIFVQQATPTTTQVGDVWISW